jgi:hypothetical protein
MNQRMTDEHRTGIQPLAAPTDEAKMSSNEPLSSSQI